MSLIFIDFNWFLLIFVDFHWFSLPVIDFPQMITLRSVIVIDCHWFWLIFVGSHQLSLFFPNSHSQVSEYRFDLIRIWDLQRLRRNGNKKKLVIWENIYLICYKYKLIVSDCHNLIIRKLYTFLLLSILVLVTMWKYISWTSYWLVLNHVISSASLVCLIEVCRSDID